MECKQGPKKVSDSAHPIAWARIVRVFIWEENGDRPSVIIRKHRKRRVECSIYIWSIPPEKKDIGYKPNLPTGKEKLFLENTIGSSNCLPISFEKQTKVDGPKEELLFRKFMKATRK